MVHNITIDSDMIPLHIAVNFGPDQRIYLELAVSGYGLIVVACRSVVDYSVALNF